MAQKKVYEKHWQLRIAIILKNPSPTLHFSQTLHHRSNSAAFVTDMLPVEISVRRLEIPMEGMSKTKSRIFFWGSTL